MEPLNMAEDCYFWIDQSVPEDKQKMNVLCVKCHDEKYPQLGWFWGGSKKGYGPFDFICEICGKVIHAAPSNVKESINENDQTGN